MLWLAAAFLLGLTGLLVATFGAIPLALACWHLAKLVRQSWLIHLAFLPVTLALTWLGTGALFYVSGDTGDGPPGLGLMMIPGLCILFITTLIYYGNVAASTLLNWWSRLKLR